MPRKNKKQRGPARWQFSDWPLSFGRYQGVALRQIPYNYLKYVLKEHRDAERSNFPEADLWAIRHWLGKHNKDSADKQTAQGQSVPPYTP